MLGLGAPRPKRLADRGRGASARDRLLPAVPSSGAGAIVPQQGEPEDTAVALNPPQLIACGNALTLALGTIDGEKSVGPVCTPDVAAARDEQVPSIFGWGSNRHNQMGMCCKPGESKAFNNPARTISDVELVYRDGRGQAIIKDGKDNEANLFEVACGSSHCVVLQKIKLVPGFQHLKATDPTADTAEKARGSSDASLAESCVWSCGLNANGQLGDGTPEDEEPLPECRRPVKVDFSTVLGIQSAASPRQNVVVQRVCCGTDHTLVIANILGPSADVSVAQGRVFSWGLGSYGALGTRSEGDGLTPQEVWFPDEMEGDRSVRIKQVAAGSKHSMALDTDGNVYAWGHGGNGRLGHSRDVLGDAAQVGQNSYSAQLVPKRVNTFPEEAKGNIVYIAAGESHSAAVDQLGVLYTWGQGTYGRLGHGMTLEVSVPTKVESLGGVAISQVALGLMHSVATTQKGLLHAWGKGPATGLDSPPHVIVTTPQEVVFREEHRGSPVYQIAAGPLHTAVLLRNGSLFCFGSASEGRIPKRDGKDTLKDQTFPFLVIEGASTGIPLAMGDNVEVREKFKSHNSNPVDLNLGEKGVVKRIDELGDALIEFPNRATCPRQWVSAMNFHKLEVDTEVRKESEGEGPIEIFCGGSNSAALMEVQKDAEPNLWFWGSDVLASYAEVPSGNRKRRGSTEGPRLLKEGFRNSVRMIAIGLEHCLAITTLNVMYTWGSGSEGQLGNGSLKSVHFPQQVTRPTDVRHVAAGEKHSACIVQAGDSYTWGAAEGGRLGLGASLSEGLQLMPKQVRIPADHVQSTHGKLLELVACGAQHTALVTKDHRLLTFGCGWYGRLGRDSVDNEYWPQPVAGDLARAQVKGVYCGMYHTCVVDFEDVLWVCGRDSSLCRDGLGHQLVPAPFEPFLEEPRRYVQSVAVSEQHTLVVTRFAGESESTELPDATELWVWGRNDHGQLGLSAQQVSAIQVPWCLRIPGLERHPGRFDIKRVATGPGHSMCLVQTRKKSGKRGDMIIYSWGCQGDDRLGLDEETLAECEEDGEVGNKEREVGGKKETMSRHAWTYPPLRMTAWWAQDGGARERAHDENDQAGESFGESRGWTDVQQKLLLEEPAQKEKRLQELHANLVKSYDVHFATIDGLWTRPQQGQFVKYEVPGSGVKSTLNTEYHMRQKERDLEMEYIRTLKALKLNMSMFQPRIDSQHIKTDSEVVEKLDKYEELLWVLQQQPVYMANLARLLQGKKIDDRDTDLFHRILRLLYCDLSFADGELRNVSLFKALLRLLISDEIEGKKSSGVEDLFDPLKSRAAILFTDYITNPVFMEPVGELVLNTEDPSSLASIVIKYTVDRFVEAITASKTDKKGTAEPTAEQHQGAAEPTARAKQEDANKYFVGFAGYFSTHPDEYRNLIFERLRSKKHPGALTAATEKEKEHVITAQKREWRQNFDDDLTRFALLCGVERKSGWKSDESTGMVEEKGTIAHFIERFIDAVAGAERGRNKRTKGQNEGEGGSRADLNASNRKHAIMPLVCAWNCLVGNARMLKYRAQKDQNNEFDITTTKEEFHKRFDAVTKAEVLVLRDKADNPDYMERWSNSSGSPPELRTGDKIVKVNGKSKNTEEMMVEIGKEKDVSQTLSLSVSREEPKWSEGICVPIASLLLTNQLAGILQALESGTCSLSKLKIKWKTKEKLKEAIDQELERIEASQQELSPGRQFPKVIEKQMSMKRKVFLSNTDFDDHVKDVQERVFWNLQALAKLFRRAIHKSMFEVDFHEFAGDGASREESVSKRCGDRLKDLTCMKLLRTFSTRGLKVTEDTSEMQLTVELFTSHLSLRRSFVRMPTSDLLELANMLWRYSAEDGQDTENILLNIMEYDKVGQLLKDILPKNSKRQDKTELWSPDGHIWLAQQHGECHNFVMSSRFLEFLPPKEAVTFCSRSLAPIPLYLAEGEQRRAFAAIPAHPAADEQKTPERSKLLVKAFHHPCEDKKPYKDHIEAYHKLENLIQDLAGDERKAVKYKIRGKTFGELRKAFEEIKKQIELDMKEGRASRAMQGLVDSLAEGVEQVTKLDHGGSSSEELLTYIDLGIQKRTHYAKYLKQIEVGLDDIKKVKANYYFSIDLEYKRLREAVIASRNCDVPVEIQQAVQNQAQGSVQLAFTRCQKYKRNARRSNQTPAQLKLESLISNNPDSKSLQELREEAQMGLPDQTFKLQELVDRGVVLRIHTDFRSNRQLVKSIRLRFWFDRATEAHHVEVIAHKMESQLPKQTFTVTREDAALMEAGRKTTIMGCGRHKNGGPLLWLSCFRLRRLLAWQFAEGDLMDTMERG